MTTVQMEERHCSKCGRPYRVMTTSKQTECSRLCQGISEWGVAKQTRRNTKGGIVDKSVDKAWKSKLPHKKRPPQGIVRSYCTDSYRVRPKPTVLDLEYTDKKNTKRQIE